ncbi:hypothetical protein BDW_04890 [Bdellovibrio bacteriovorus W]|nr:hypothetical protein BDW_04890 [Bdellovibrio bacteriovorus W]
MKDIIDSAVQGVKNRFLDPLPGTYTVFFLLLNWKTLIYLFSKEEVASKIVSIENVIFYPRIHISTQPLLSKLLFNSFSVAFVLTVFYFAIQKILSPVYEYLENIKVRNINIHTQASKRLTSIEDEINRLQNLYSNEFEKRNKADELSKAREETINSLNKHVKSLEETILIMQKEKITLERHKHPTEEDTPAESTSIYHQPIEDYALTFSIPAKQAYQIYVQYLFKLIESLETLRPHSKSIKFAKDCLEKFNHGNDEETTLLNHAISTLGAEFNNSNFGKESREIIIDFIKTAEKIISFHK